MKPPPVACAMIVRNAEASIERCIRSVRPHVAGVWILLAGESTDGTVEVLERLQAEPGAPIVLEHGPWRDDYAEARTRGFAMIDPALQWVLWIDSDDELVHGEQVPVAAVLGERHRLPYVFIEHEYDWLDGTRRRVPRARIVHRDRGRWEGIIHEDYRATGAAAGLDVVRSLHVPGDVMYLRHQPHAETRPDGYAFYGKQPGHYLPLILKATEDVERTPRAFYYLAREYAALGRWDDALEAVHTYIGEHHDSVEGDPNSWRRDALNLGADIARRAGDVPTEGALRHEHRAYSKRIEEHLKALVSARQKVGRNDPCDCGSGLKWKKCCGAAVRLDAGLVV